MRESTNELWQRLQQFDFDGGPSAFTFRDWLARDNGWTRAHASRVVEEYRRFLLLSTVAGHPVTPSEDVDQAWHLHLTYTRSYWDDLCRVVLPAPLHHGPTRGGGAEDAKFHDWYARTLDSYRRELGLEPPADIWPPEAIRFGDPRRYARIDTASVWILRKPAWWPPRRQALIAALLLAVGVTSSCAAAASAFGMVLFSLAAIACVGWVVAWGRSEARQRRRGDERGGSDGHASNSSTDSDSGRHDSGQDCADGSDGGSGDCGDSGGGGDGGGSGCGGGGGGCGGGGGGD